MSRRKLVLVFAAVVALLAGWYYSSGSQTPSGQPALVRITEDNFRDLPSVFNAASGNTRIVVLLSPT